MTKKIIYLSLILFVISCNQTTKNYIAKVKLSTLKEGDMFNKEMVYDVIFDAEELKIDSLKNKSHQLFLQGIDLYKNKNKQEEAVALFKQSILVFPESKTYYELGNALLDSKKEISDLKAAMGAFEVAEYLNFQPTSMVLYKEACAENMLIGNDNRYSENSVSSVLEDAFNKGFSDTAMLKEDNHINSILKTAEYKRVYTEIQSRKLFNSENSLFDLYVKSFPVNASASFEIGLENVGKSDYGQSINYEFSRFIPEMQNSEFGREVSHDYFFVAKVTETPVYTAVLYSSVSFYGEEMQPVTVKLVTYNKKGEMLASKIFAGQFSAEKIKIGKIEKNEITLQDYKRVWKQPIGSVNIEDNKVEKYELIAKATFILDDSGLIKEVSVPSNYVDSVIVAKN